jgi:DNA-binding NarL/FixJ family response regulator
MMETNSPIKVLLADDHQIFLDCLKRVLEDEPNMEIVGMALDGKEVLDMLAEIPLDVLVLDYQMPRMNGLETLQELAQTYPDVKTIVLSFSDEGKIIHDTMCAGAKGYIVKNRGALDLVEAITKVAEGGRFFPLEVSSALSEYMSNGHVQLPPPTQIEPAVKLSEREVEVIACLLDGMSAKMIADTLCITKATVESHKQNIIKRFGFHNSAQVAAMGKERGIRPWSQRHIENK